MKKEELELAAKQKEISSPQPIEIVQPIGPVETNIIIADVNPKPKADSPAVSDSSDQSQAA